MSVPLLILVAALAGQPPAASPPSSPAPDGQRAAARRAPVSVDGCVITGKEAGRKADLREKTGLDEQFVLAGATVVKGKAPRASGAGAMLSGPGAMFKISGLTDEQLRIHVGRRVRIEGRFGGLEQPSAPADTAPQDNLVELAVTTIRQVPGECVVPRS